MIPIEKREIKGLTIGQFVTVLVAIVGFVVSLVVRDIKRENQVETIKLQIEAIENKNAASAKEREALKTESHNQDKRLTRVETLLENQNNR